MEKYSTYLSERKYLSLNEYEIDIYKEIYWKKMLGVQIPAHLSTVSDKN